MMMGFGLLGFFLTLVLLIGLIAGAVFLVRGLSPGLNQSSTAEMPTGGSAKQILDERFARGEISQPEYEDMKENLTT